MRRPLIILAVVFVALLGAITVSVVSNPLRQSDEALRGWLFRQTPMGSTSAEVRAVLDRRGWTTDGYRSTQPRPAKEPFLAGELGGYQGLPWYVSVAAFWEFDGNDRLTAIRVLKKQDAP